MNFLTPTINQLIRQALREDKTNEDWTTKLLVSSQAKSRAKIICQEQAVLCGLTLAQKVFKQLDPQLKFHTKFKDGSTVKKNTVIVTLHGKTRAILTGERPALNFIGYLSGIATITRQYVQQTANTRAQIYDTRKTTPTLRSLEKYAVHCGGGQNHRLNLEEMILFKDNHRAVLKGKLDLKAAVQRYRRFSKRKIIIEVDNLIQFQKALEVNPDIILLDNMTVTQIKGAVRVRNRIKQSSRRPLLEISGGVTLNTIHRLAITGVERISVGALTHTHKAIPVSLEILP